jgi:hypothetical protein
MKTPKQKIPLLDLTGLTAFQRLHGNSYEMTMQGNRGVAMFEANRTFYELAEKFNRNEPVQVIDFLQAQREVKAELMTLKQGHSENANGRNYGNSKY